MAVAQYRETLWPRVWVWMMPVAFASCLGIAYGYAYDARAGWLVALGTAGVLLAWLALASRTLVEVDDQTLRAGRARLPMQFVGGVRALDSAQTFEARTRRADPAAYLLLRPWASARSVAVEVTDEADPHPYWLVSSRRPQELAQAIANARDASRTG
jgi:hypothetical protein